MTGRAGIQFGSHHSQSNEPTLGELLALAADAPKLKQLYDDINKARTDADEYAANVKASVAGLYEKAQEEANAKSAECNLVLQNTIANANRNADQIVSDATIRANTLMQAAQDEATRIRALAQAALDNSNKLQTEAQNANAQAQQVLQEAQVEAVSKKAEARELLMRATKLQQDLL